MEHPTEACLAEVLVIDPGGRFSRGSGYRVARGWVLTAAHVVQKSARITVWFGAPTELRANEGLAVDPAVVRMVQELDLALLPVPDATVGPGFAAPAFGTLDRDSSVQVPTVAAGFPWFKLRPAPGRAGVELRDAHYATALVVGGSNLRTGTLAFPVTGPPPERHPDPLRSPWEGMSGAAVFAAGYLVGVVGQHHLRDGLGTLTVRPLQLPPGNDLGLSPETLQRWGKVLPQLRLTLPVLTPPTARELAALRAQRTAAKLAPPVLVGRLVDLAQLAEFCTAGEPPWRWMQAPAFSGKTALLAWFALHPPETVDVAACFLQMTTTDNTASYALTVLNLQLAALVGRAQYQPPTEISDRVSDFLDDLLPAAAMRGQQLGRRLLLVVDGLDEYSQEETRPLGAWLPDAASLPAGVSVLVSSRAGVLIPLPDAHPLRFYVDELAPSAAATELRALATKELNDAVKAEPVLRYEILACLAACGGGISSEGLQMWLARRGHPVLAGYLGAQIARWYHRTVRVAEDPDGLTGDTLAFSHDTLREAAEETFERSIAQLRDELHAWAEECRGKGWPADTPPHLLTVYPRLLTQIRDTARLTALALDGLRHDRMFTVMGGDAAALDEIRSAQALLLAADDPDLLSMGLLARHRDHLAIRNWSTPTDLPGLWATLGHPNRALAIARAIHGPEPRVLAFTGLVRALAVCGDKESTVNAAELAQTAAARVAYLWQQSRLLNDLVDALTAAHEFCFAQSTATMITNRDDQAQALAKVTAMSAAAGEYDVAQDCAAMITNREARAGAYAALVGALADDGNYDLARSTAITIRHRDARARALAALVKAHALVGQDDQAAELADLTRNTAVKIGNPEARVTALTALVEGLAAGAREHGSTGPLVDRAVAIATTISEQRIQDQALTTLATALANVGNHQDALSIAEMITDEADRARALTALTETLGNIGNHQGALSIAEMITDEADRARALTALTGTLGNIGNHQGAAQAAAFAQKTASAIVDPGARARTLTALLGALAAAGDHERAASVADLAQETASAIADPGTRARTLTALLGALAAAGDHERAASVADLAQETASAIADPGTRARTLTALLGALAAAGDHERAASVADLAEASAAAITEPPEQAWAIIQLTNILDRVGEHRRAARVIAQLPEATGTTMPDPFRSQRGWRELSWTVASLVSALVRVGYMDRAIRLAHFAYAARPTYGAHFAYGARPTYRGLFGVAEAFSALVQALTAVGEDDVADAMTRAHPGQYWDTATLNVPVENVADESQHDAAEYMIGFPLEFGGDPLLDLTRALASAGEYVLAENIASSSTDPDSQARWLIDLIANLAAVNENERAEAIATTIADPYWRAQATTTVAKTIAASDHNRAAQLADLALTTAATIPQPLRQAQVLTALAKALAAAGDDERAAELAELAWTAAAAADVTARWQQGSARAAAVEAMAAAGMLERAQANATDLADPGREQAFTALIDALATTSERERAYTVATSITDPYWRALALTTMANVLASNDEHERAGQLTSLAHATATTVSDRVARADVLTTLATTFAANGEYDRAQAAATSITNPSARARALTALVQTFAARHHKPLTQVAELAQTAATHIRSPRARAEALIALVKALAAAGDYHRATQLARLAHTTTTGITNPSTRTRVLTDLTPALAAAGEYELAHTTAISIGDASWKRKALMGLTNAFTAAGEYDRANAAAISITGPRARAEAMTGLVEALAAATNSQPKHELAQTTAMAIADPYWKTRAITAVASAFTVDGDLERVRRLADFALATAASVTRLEERAQALASLTEVLAVSGEYKRALTTASKITDPNGQAEALTTLATVMTRKGDIRQSRQTLAQAWAVGNWEIPLPGLAEIDAEVLQQLVEVEAPRRPQ